MRIEIALASLTLGAGLVCTPVAGADPASPIDQVCPDGRVIAEDASCVGVPSKTVIVEQQITFPDGRKVPDKFGCLIDAIDLGVPCPGGTPAAAASAPPPPVVPIDQVCPDGRVIAEDASCGAVP